MAFLTTSIPDPVTGELNVTKKCPLRQDNWTFSVIPVYILFIAVVGIVLNLFVLMVFCLHKKVCNVPEIYLSNLAAADLLLVSCLPFWAVHVAKHFHWPFGRTLCKVVNMGIYMNVYSSIYFLVLVSIDRYLALVHPLTPEKTRRNFHAKIRCVFVWILGFLMSVPTLIYREIKENSNRTSCYLKYPNVFSNMTAQNEKFLTKLMFDSPIFILGFVIPIVIISFCTLRILKALRNRLAEGVNVQKVDNKATTLVLAVLLAFQICWIPFHLVKIPEMLKLAGVLKQCYLLEVLHVCQQFFVYFAFFNSVLNPILYVIVGKTFRKKVVELFKQWGPTGESAFSLSYTSSSYFLRNVKAQDTLSRSADG